MMVTMKKEKPFLDTDSKKLLIIISIVAFLYLGWSFINHNNWCQKNAKLRTIGSGITKKEYYATDIMGKKGKYETYDDAVTSCKARWSEFIFKKGSISLSV